MIQNRIPNYIISLFIKSFSCIVGTVLFLYTPNGVDGLYMDENIYIYGFRDIILFFVCTLLFNAFVLSSEITIWFKRRFGKSEECNQSRRFYLKVLLFVLSLIALIFSVFSIRTIKVTEDSLIIKRSIFAQEERISYKELEECDVFVAGDNDVYWGERTEIKPKGTSHYYDYDIYLGKLENSGRLINQINEKSGRCLTVD